GFVTAERELSRLGVEATVRFCVENKVEADAVPLVIERAVLEKWIDSILRDDSRLRSLRAEDRNQLVDEFRKLARESIRGAPVRVIEACNRRRPQTTAGSAGIILREGEKQRKHMPTRELLARTQDVVLSTFPCLMMSPLTVSQFLPSDIRFDAVVFDEASQLRPSDAANCLYRA